MIVDYSKYYDYEGFLETLEKAEKLIYEKTGSKEVYIIFSDEALKIIEPIMGKVTWKC